MRAWGNNDQIGTDRQVLSNGALYKTELTSNWTELASNWTELASNWTELANQHVIQLRLGTGVTSLIIHESCFSFFPLLYQNYSYFYHAI